MSPSHADESAPVDAIPEGVDGHHGRHIVGEQPSADPAAPAESTEEGGGQPDPNRWRALVIILIGGGIVLLDVSIVNVALESISKGLPGASDEAVQWVLSGYALSFGLLLVPGGRLGDITGRRRMFVLGIGLFTLASAFCGFAPNGVFLVIARLVQGLAGGLLTPQVTALIQQLFQGKERGTAFGLFGATTGIATAIGPLAGGALIAAFGETEGWRFVFYVNLPIGIITILLAFRLIPSDEKQREKKRHDFDPVGIALLGGAVVALLLPFVQAQEWPGGAKYLLILVAVALGLAFVFWERRYARTREAVVDLGLFTRRSFSLGVLLATMYFGGFTPLFFVLTLTLQSGLKYSALLAGVSSVSFAVGSGIAAAIGGRIVHRFGRQLIVVGCIFVLWGLAGVIVVVKYHYGPDLGWWLVVPLLVGGIGSGLTIAPNQTLTLSEVPVSQGGTAGGLIQVGARVGSAIGIAAVGSLFYGTLASQRGDFSKALPVGLAVSLGFVAAAMVAGIIDSVIGRARRNAS